MEEFTSTFLSSSSQKEKKGEEKRRQAGPTLSTLCEVRLRQRGRLNPNLVLTVSLRFPNRARENTAAPRSPHSLPIQRRFAGRWLAGGASRRFCETRSRFVSRPLQWRCDRAFLFRGSSPGPRTGSPSRGGSAPKVVRRARLAFFRKASHQSCSVSSGGSVVGSGCRAP